MTSSSPPGDLVVRLLDGRSEQRELVLEAGRPQPPCAVGTANPSGWRVEAGDVAPVHVLLAFNGVELYVCAARGEQALLNGVPIGAMWVVASVPSELHFGSARLSIATQPGQVAVVSPLAASQRRPGAVDDEQTSVDAQRLAEALHLSMQGPHVEPTARAELPAPVRRPALTAPLPPRRRPAIRPIDTTGQLLRGLHSRTDEGQAHRR